MIPTATRTTLVSLALASTLTLAGCNIVGPIALIVEGPPTIDAQHTLERDRPTVIFVDDRTGVLPRPSLRQVIAEEAQKFLLSQRQLTQLVDSKAILRAAAAEKVGQTLAMTELAKSVQAEVMIYVAVESFGLSSDGQSYSPAAVFRVKVLDVGKDQPRVWPEEREGAPFTAILNRGGTPIPSSVSDVAKAEQQLAAQSGKALAQVFYKHEVMLAASKGK